MCQLRQDAPIASRTTLHVSLTPALSLFVEERLRSGRYQTASEVVREALRLLEGRDREPVRSVEERESEIGLDLYDIRDLTLGVPSDDIRLHGNGFELPPEPITIPGTRLPGPVIAGLIRGFVDPAAWERDDTRLEYREPGTLVVKAPRAMHDRIRRLLRILREAEDG